MPVDPRRFDQTDDALEKRLEVIFLTLGPTNALRPTDLPSVLVLAQEIWDKLNVKGSR